jgi:hypothetical protein
MYTGRRRANQPARAGINLPRAPEGISRLFSLYPSAIPVDRPRRASYSTLSRPSSRVQRREMNPRLLFPRGLSQTSARRRSRRRRRRRRCRRMSCARVDGDYEFTMLHLQTAYAGAARSFVLYRFARIRHSFSSSLTKSMN